MINCEWAWSGAGVKFLVALYSRDGGTDTTLSSAGDGDLDDTTEVTGDGDGEDATEEAEDDEESFVLVGGGRGAAESWEAASMKEL